MPRNIDADVLMQTLCNMPNINFTTKDMMHLVQCMPTADVAEVKHGKWILGKDIPSFPTVPYFPTTLYCSECRNEAYWDTDYGQQEFDWCPYCGAKMDGKETANEKD